MTNKKLCVNCAHFKPAVLDNKRARLMYASCVSPHIKRVDNYVVGGQDPQFDKCAAQRTLDYISCRIYGMCGVEGRFFESRRNEQKGMGV